MADHQFRLGDKCLESHPLRFLRNLRRTREILTVLLNHGFGDVVERLHLRQYLQWGKRIIFRGAAEPVSPRTRGDRIRQSLESLGATFVKFGQVISTRPDLVPADVIEELKKLREHVTPFSSEQAIEILERDLGALVSELFAEFEVEPIAGGSLAQVHRAKHHNGTALAVKIRRPNVVRDVESDIALMLELAILVDRHIPEAQVFDPIGLVNHFARTIRRELNFTREARTTDEFARLFRNDATLHVPQPFWELTTEAVFTMEFIDGIRLDDMSAVDSLGLSRREIGANGARIFMKQAFELGLFHGDPHPGNVRLMQDGSFCLIDYGMIGMLEDEQRDLLVDLFLAISRQNVASAVDVIQKLGNPFRPIDVPLLRADVREFVETYYGLSLERLKIGSMLSEFVSILSIHGIRCPADFMLLIRAIVTLEGTGRSLDPNFNLAEHLSPFVERVVKERYSPSRIRRRLVGEIQTFTTLAHDVPLRMGEVLEKLSKDDLRIQLEHRRLDRLITEIDRSSNRIVVSLVMSSLILASALIYRTLAESYWISIPVFVVSSLLAVWLIYGVFRSGRL